MDQRGGRLKPYEHLTKPKENHTKTILKADGPTRGTNKTIRKPYKTIEKLYENHPESGTIKPFDNLTKPYENYPKRRWANEGDD